MFKFSYWDYLKFTLVLSILTSVFFMKTYENYGSKGEYILSEYGAESFGYQRIPLTLNEKGNEINSNDKLSANCKIDCVKDCTVNQITNKIDIMQCLDSCACNTVDYNIINTPPNSFSFLWIILMGVVTIGAFLTFYKQETEEIYNYVLLRLKIGKKNNLQMSIFDDEGVDNEYRKLTDY